MLQLIDKRELIRRLDLPIRLIDSKLRCNSLGRRQSIATRHDAAHASGFQSRQCFNGIGLNRIGYGEEAPKVAIDTEVHDARALRAQRLARDVNSSTDTPTCAIKAVLPRLI
jgi:hypothetical protein